jgi:hypothetical protein
MNSAVAFATVSVVLQLVALLMDRKMEVVDLPLFRHQVSENVTLGIKKWFNATDGNKLGEGRTQIILRMAMLSASVRSTLTSLLMCLLGLGLACVIFAVAAPAPSWLAVRMCVALVVGVIVLIVMVMLFLRLVHAGILPIPVPDRDGTRQNKFREVLHRHCQPEYLTLYKSTIFVSNTATIILAFGA